MPVWVALAVITLAWIGLGRTVLHVGPSEWDDNLYCDMAAMPRPTYEVVNRYVHIWTLRLFNLLIDSRRDAAAWYANLVVVGMSWMGFFLGRRLGGAACGLLSALLMPLYPAMLRYLTVPYPDPPMTLWSGLALVAALAAGDRSSDRSRIVAGVASGVFCFLSVKCKETGLSVLPAVFLALGSNDRKLRAAVLWLAGALAGWLLLSLADWAFMNDFWWSWRWTNYFPKPGEPPIAGTVRQDSHYMELLLSTEFIAFTLLGAAGAVAGCREKTAVRYVALWSFSALVFSTLISCRYMGLHALDRYCVAIGAPLVILSAYWIVSMWRRAAGTESNAFLGWLAAVAITSGVAIYGLLAELSGKAGPYASRFAFFMMPAALVVLFLAPWLTRGRGWVKLSLALMVLAAATVSVKHARDYVERKRAIMAPWLTLAAAMDETGAQLARWNLPSKPYAAFRIGRRCRVLSKRPPGDTQVRDIIALSDVKENEWLFSSPEVAAQVKAEGWTPLVKGAEQGGAFVVYRR